MMHVDKTEEVRRLGMGRLLSDLSHKMQNVVKAKSNGQEEPKILVHSTHDTALAGLCSTLDVFDDKFVLSLRPRFHSDTHLRVCSDGQHSQPRSRSSYSRRDNSRKLIRKRFYKPCSELGSRILSIVRSSPVLSITLHNSYYGTFRRSNAVSEQKHDSSSLCR